MTQQFEDILQQMKPVIGKKRADAIWHIYNAFPDDRKQIETELKLRMSRILGKTFEQETILLDPPAAEAATGEYPLGSVIYGHRSVCDFGLHEYEFLRHITILGITGSGKTNVGLGVIRLLLEHGKPFTVFDWKRNYRDILVWEEAREVIVYTVGRDVSPLAFNPLLPPKGTSPSIWLKKLIEILSHVYFLGDGAESILLNAIDSVYEDCGMYSDTPRKTPLLKDVLTWIENYPAKSRKAQWKTSCVRTLERLCHREVGHVFNPSKQAPIEEMLKQSVILELEALADDDKTFLIESMLLWIHHYRMLEPGREQFKHAIIIEEAHHIFLKKKEARESIPEVIMREIRELGEGIILIDQNPSKISIPALGNTYTTIAMNLKHNADIVSVAEAMLLEQADREYLGQLEVGYGIVKLQGRHFRPFLVKFPLVKIEKGSTTDEILRVRFAGLHEPEREIPPAGQEIPDILPPGAAGNKEEEKLEISDDDLLLLEGVMNHGLEGSACMLSLFPFGPGFARRGIDRLEEASFISSHYVSTGRGRVRIFLLTPRGAAILRKRGLDPAMPELSEGPEHFYWKMRAAATYREHGYDTSVEHVLDNGHAVDVSAAKGEERIACEIERGSSDYLGNIQRCLDAGFTRVVVLDVSGQIYGKIQEAFSAVIASSRIRVLRPQDVSLNPLALNGL